MIGLAEVRLLQSEAAYVEQAGAGIMISRGEWVAMMTCAKPLASMRFNIFSSSIWRAGESALSGSSRM